MRRFVTIFDKANNVHLIKDVGQIPWMMHHLFNYDAAIVTHRKGIQFGIYKRKQKGLILSKYLKFGWNAIL